MKPPQFPEFKIIGLEDKSLFDDFVQRFPPEVCEINFTNIFIWRKFEHSKSTAINGNLCVLCEPPSEPAYFLPPIGDTDPAETVRACLTFAPRLSRVPQSYARRFCTECRCEPDPDNFDYVYLAEDLIHLKGKKYDGRRNRIRKFERTSSFSYLRLGPEHLDGCRSLLEKWFAGKANSDWVIHAEKEAILEALGHFEALGLTGGAIEIGGRIAAFSLGERLGGDTAVIHIEIADPEFQGLAQTINREFVKNEWSGFRFINREQDCGIPGLRRAKQSYYPHHMVEKYNVWKA